MMTQTSISMFPLSLTQRIGAALVAAVLGMTLIAGIGFAGDMRVHNGAHDTRHTMGFPCH